MLMVEIVSERGNHFAFRATDIIRIGCLDSGKTEVKVAGNIDIYTEEPVTSLMLRVNAALTNKQQTALKQW